MGHTETIFVEIRCVQGFTIGYIRAVLISHFFSIRLIDYFFFDVDVLDWIMSRALVLGKVWWGPDQHHTFPSVTARDSAYCSAVLMAAALAPHFYCEIKAQGRLL